MALPIRTVRQSDQLQQEKNSDDAEKEKEKNIYYQIIESWFVSAAVAATGLKTAVCSR